MDTQAPEAKRFLQQLYQSTAGKSAEQASMFDIGAAIGLERTAAGKIAEELIGNGLVEVKTLSGGIGITPQGIEAVQALGGTPGASGDLALNDGPLLDDAGRQAVEAVLADLRGHIAQTRTGYSQLEEMVVDIKTIEVQLLSPKPKTAILREALFSLQSALKAAGAADTALRLSRMTGR